MCIGFSWLEREAGPGEAMFKSIEDQKAKELASSNLINCWARGVLLQVDETIEKEGERHVVGISAKLSPDPFHSRLRNSGAFHE